jgi:hypothetical protein
MRKIILITAVSAFCFLSCKKNDSSSPPITKKDILTTGSWKLTAAVSDENGDGTYEINDYKEFEACFTDNVYTFKTDNTVVLDEGGSKCDDSDPQSITSTWQLVNNDTNIVIDVDTYLIQELSNSKLIVKLVYTGLGNSVLTFNKK